MRSDGANGRRCPPSLAIPLTPAAPVGAPGSTGTAGEGSTAKPDLRSACGAAAALLALPRRDPPAGAGWRGGVVAVVCLPNPRRCAGGRGVRRPRPRVAQDPALPSCSCAPTATVFDHARVRTTMDGLVQARCTARRQQSLTASRCSVCFCASSYVPRRPSKSGRSKGFCWPLRCSEVVPGLLGRATKAARCAPDEEQTVSSRQARCAAAQPRCAAAAHRSAPPSSRRRGRPNTAPALHAPSAQDDRCAWQSREKRSAARQSAVECGVAPP